MEATKILLVKSNHTITRSSILICRLSIMFIVFVIPFVGTLLFYLRIICRIRQTYTDLMGLAAQVLPYILSCSLPRTYIQLLNHIYIQVNFPIQIFSCTTGTPSQPAQRGRHGGHRPHLHHHLLGPHHCLLGHHLHQRVRSCH